MTSNTQKLTDAREERDSNARKTETVYDAQGKPYELELVDAREYIASGHYFAQPPHALTTARALSQQASAPKT